MPSAQLNSLYSNVISCPISIEWLTEVGQYFSDQYRSKSTSYTRYRRAVSPKIPPELVRHALTVSIAQTGYTQYLKLKANSQAKQKMLPEEVYAIASKFQAQLGKLKGVEALNNDEQLNTFKKTAASEAEEEVKKQFLEENGVVLSKQPVEELNTIALLFTNFTGLELHQAVPLLSDEECTTLVSFESYFKGIKANDAHNRTLDNYLAQLSSKFNKWSHQLSVTLQNEINHLNGEIIDSRDAIDNIKTAFEEGDLKDSNEELFNHLKKIRQIEYSIEEKAINLERGKNCLAQFREYLDAQNQSSIRIEEWPSVLSEHIQLVQEATALIKDECEIVQSISNVIIAMIEAGQIEWAEHTSSAEPEPMLGDEAVHTSEADNSAKLAESLQVLEHDENNRANADVMPESDKNLQEERGDNTTGNESTHSDDEDQDPLAFLEGVLAKHRYESGLVEGTWSDINKLTNAELAARAAEKQNERDRRDQLPSYEEVVTAEVQNVSDQSQVHENEVVIDIPEPNNTTVEPNAAIDSTTQARNGSSSVSGETVCHEQTKRMNKAQSKSASSITSEVHYATNKAADNTENSYTNYPDEYTQPIRSRRRREHRVRDDQVVDGKNYHISPRSSYSSSTTPAVADVSAASALKPASQGFFSGLKERWRKSLEEAQLEAAEKEARKRAKSQKRLSSGSNKENILSGQSNVQGELERCNHHGREDQQRRGRSRRSERELMRDQTEDNILSDRKHRHKSRHDRRRDASIYTSRHDYDTQQTVRTEYDYPRARDKSSIRSKEPRYFLKQDAYLANLRASGDADYDYRAERNSQPLR